MLPSFCKGNNHENVVDAQRGRQPKWDPRDLVPKFMLLAHGRVLQNKSGAMSRRQVISAW